MYCFVSHQKTYQMFHISRPTVYDSFNIAQRTSSSQTYWFRFQISSNCSGGTGEVSVPISIVSPDKAGGLSFTSRINTFVMICWQLPPDHHTVPKGHQNFCLNQHHLHWLSNVYNNKHLLTAFSLGDCFNMGPCFLSLKTAESILADGHTIRIDHWNHMNSTVRIHF